MELTTNALAILEKRYLKKDGNGKVVETPEDLFKRVAKAISSVEKEKDKWYQEFLDMMLNLYFLPNSPTLLNAGLNGNLSACFVLKVEDSLPGIMKTLSDTIIIHSTGGGCIAEGSSVYIKELGIVPIEEVKNSGYHTLSYDEKNSKFVFGEITQLHTFENEKAIKVTLEGNRNVTVSEWHPFLVWDGKKIIQKKAQDLIAEDYVLTPCIDSLGVKICSDDEAWLLGFFVGDGSFSCNCIRFFEPRKEVQNKLLKILKKMTGNDHTIQKVGERGDYIQVRKESFINWIKSFGFEEGKKSLITSIPSPFMKTDSVLPFIAGLFDAEGWQRKDGSLFLEVASKKLAEQVSQILNLYGIHTRFKVIIPKKESPLTKTKTIMYRVGITRNRCLQRLNDFIKKDLCRFILKERAVDKEIVKVSPEIEHTKLTSTSYYYWRKGKSTLSLSTFLTILKDERIKKIIKNIVKIRKIEKLNNIKFYDFTIKKYQNYAAGNNGLMMVHNTGFSFSDIRSQGSGVRENHGVAMGPIAVMRMFNGATEEIKQSGVRRGANMGILRCDHPNILEFINCKNKEGNLNNFNITVALTDKFIQAVQKNQEYDLIDPHTKKVVKRIKAKEVFNQIVENAWKTGEPGICFIDRINKCNPVPHLGEIQSSNPCFGPDEKLLTVDGEKTFKELENTDPFIINRHGAIVKSKVWKSGVKETIKLILADDTSIICTPEQLWIIEGCKEAQAKDLKGCNLIKFPIIGELKTIFVKDVIDNGICEVYDFIEPLFGWGIVNGFIAHNCGEIWGVPYFSCNLGSINVAKLVENKQINWDLLKRLVHTGVRFLDDVIDVNVYPLDEIGDLARKIRPIGLGVMGFADMLIKMEVSYNSREALDIAEELMKFIHDEGWKSSEELAKEKGAFPEFEKSKLKKKEKPVRNCQVTTIAPTGTLSIIAGVSSGIEPHFSFEFFSKQAGIELKWIHPEYAKYIGGNIPDYFVTSGQILASQHVNIQATFQRYTDNSISKTVNFSKDTPIEDVAKVYWKAWDSNCKGLTVYRDGSREEQVLYTKKNNSTLQERPKRVYGFTEEVEIGCGSLYVTVNTENGKLFEAFTMTGNFGGCPSQSEAIARLISLALRSGASSEKIVDQLKKVKCHSASRQKKPSCPQAIGNLLLNEKENNVEVIMEKCPECNQELTRSEGCFTCKYCGYSKCS